MSASRDLGREWLLGMQNPDGGWSAFVHGLPAKRPGPLFSGPVEVSLDDPVGAVRTLLDPPRELGDPSTEDLTGRVLDGLGRLGLTTASPAVGRAIEFLRAQQFDHGGFWGRWTVNYLASTACVFRASRASAPTCPSPGCGTPSDSCSSARTMTGVGRASRSYRDSALAGRGPSMPPLTGLVLTGLIDAGEGSSDAVERGVAYLLDQQRADGTWPHGDWLQAIVPPDTFYILAEAAKHYPVEALARGSNSPDLSRLAEPYSGWGDCVPATASHMRSVSTARWPMNSRADGVTGYRVRGRLAVTAFSIVLATASGPPPSREAGPRRRRRWRPRSPR